MSQYLFKIQYPNGQFSAGKSYPRPATVGKTWGSARALRSHLTMIGKRALEERYAGCKVIAIKLDFEGINVKAEKHPFHGKTPQEVHALPRGNFTKHINELYSFVIRNKNTGEFLGSVGRGRWGVGRNGTIFTFSRLRTALKGYRYRSFNSWLKGSSGSFEIIAIDRFFKGFHIVDFPIPLPPGSSTSQAEIFESICLKELLKP